MPASKTTHTETPRSPVGRFVAIHLCAFVVACVTTAASFWTTAHTPASALLIALLFGRVASAGLFRLDRLRWGEWGLYDARLWLWVTCCGSAMALPVLVARDPTSAARFLLGEALFYGLSGLLFDDALRFRRSRLTRREQASRRPCFIYGSRGPGRSLAQRLMRNPGALAPFAYLDDDPRLQQTVIDGIPVLGHLDDLARLAQLHAVYDVVAPASDEGIREAASQAGVESHTDSAIRG